MLEALRLRLEGPLMSFGGVAVDSHRPTLPLPTSSMLTGLLANALGYDHRDHALTQRLQERLRYAARRDRLGDTRVDYQTVDLGLPWMNDKHAWTTNRAIEVRKGGTEARYGTHIRWRHYHVDAVFTVALALSEAEQAPTLDHLEQALRNPERPLFLGRKTCIPAAPLLLDRVQCPSLKEAVVTASPHRADRVMRVWWPTEDADPSPHEVRLRDLRDWRNQIHVGERLMFEADHETPEVFDGK